MAILFGPLIDTRARAPPRPRVASRTSTWYIVVYYIIIVVVYYFVYTILYSSNHSNKKIIIIILHAAAYNRENVSVDCRVFTLLLLRRLLLCTSIQLNRSVDYRTYWAKSNGNTPHKYTLVQRKIFEIPTNVGFFF